MALRTANDLPRCFSTRELASQLGKKKPLPSLQARLLAKRLVRDGLGEHGCAIAVPLASIEVLNNEHGCPYVVCSSAVETWLREAELAAQISLSHEREVVMAVVRFVSTAEPSIAADIAPKPNLECEGQR